MQTQLDGTLGMQQQALCAAYAAARARYREAKLTGKKAIRQPASLATNTCLARALRTLHGFWQRHVHATKESHMYPLLPAETDEIGAARVAAQWECLHLHAEMLRRIRDLPADRRSAHAGKEILHLHASTMTHEEMEDMNPSDACIRYDCYGATAILA